MSQVTTEECLWHAMHQQLLLRIACHHSISDHPAIANHSPIRFSFLFVSLKQPQSSSNVGDQSRPGAGPEQNNDSQTEEQQGSDIPAETAQAAEQVTRPKTWPHSVARTSPTWEISKSPTVQRGSTSVSSMLLCPLGILLLPTVSPAHLRGFWEDEEHSRELPVKKGIC